MRFSGAYNDAPVQIDEHRFEVEGACSLHLLLVTGAFEHVLVYVRDPAGRIRALLSYKTRIHRYVIAAEPGDCTNGAVPGALPDGAWTLEIVRTYPVPGGYEIKIECCSDIYGEPAEETVNPLEVPFGRQVDARARWYRGDLHLHTAWTDGRVSIARALAEARRKGLDYVALTDHSIATTRVGAASAQGLLVVPSTEVSWDDGGHFNVHGLRSVPDYVSFLRGAATKDGALDALLRAYASDGALLTVNHPFPYGWTLDHDYDISSIDTIEVLNAPHLLDPEVDNERAVRFFDYLWDAGCRLMAVGGSDAHKENYFGSYPVGGPTTCGGCAGLSVRNLLESLRRGHSFIQVREEFEVAFRRPGDPKAPILPGSRVSGPVEFKARCKAPVVWQLVRNGSPAVERTGRSFDEVAEAGPGDVLRVQARDASSGELLLFVNPVHDCEDRAPARRFQDLLAGFERRERRD